MKKSQIIGLVVIAIAASIVLTTFDDASAYVSFKEAKEMAEDGENEGIHVVGQLKRNAAGEPVGMVYDPVRDPNYFSFLLIDDTGFEQKVIHFGHKPEDIERSEKVVIIGKYKGETFVASKMLLKCPSKYVEDEIKTEEL